jgi:hypothetical protein
VGEEFLARPGKPFGGGRPWLRRTRALCKFNCGKGLTDHLELIWKTNLNFRIADRAEASKNNGRLLGLGR